MPIHPLAPRSFIAWDWDMTGFWSALVYHLGSGDFMFFLVVAALIMIFAVQFVYYPLLYRAHDFRARAAMRIAYYMGGVTCAVVYLNLFWCFYAPLQRSYWAGVVLATFCLVLLVVGLLLPRQRIPGR